MHDIRPCTCENLRPDPADTVSCRATADRSCVLAASRSRTELRVSSGMFARLGEVLAGGLLLVVGPSGRGTRHGWRRRGLNEYISLHFVTMHIMHFRCQLSTRPSCDTCTTVVCTRIYASANIPTTPRPPYCIHNAILRCRLSCQTNYNAKRRKARAQPCLCIPETDSPKIRSRRVPSLPTCQKLSYRCAAERRAVMQSRVLNECESLKYRTSKRNEEYYSKVGRAAPPQSGILTPSLRLRLTSMRPHLSSHSLPFSLYWIFHGSSNAENLS